MRRGGRTRLLALVALGLAACDEPLDEQVSRITAPRVLAVVATPAEAAPGAAVDYAAVVASPDGTVAAPALAWAYCTAPKPPTEDNVVAPACVDDPAAWLPLGDGATIAATVPADACRTYGPDVPATGARPRDPDASGGYYQPVRVALAGAPLTVGLHRLRGGLGDAPPAIAAEFRRRYLPNQHPTLASFATSDGATAIAPGATVALVATWPAAAAEPYVAYDRGLVAIVARREALRVGWFATGGALAADATGVAADDPATATQVRWTAPATPGPVHLWAVLHDDRGGVAVAGLDLDVR